MPDFIHMPRVRFMEVDQQGVIYHMWYMLYFEDARNAMIAAGGSSLQHLNVMGYDIQIVHSTLDWKGPVRWGDSPVVTVEVASMGTTSFSLNYAAMVDQRAAVTGSAVYVTIDKQSHTKIPVPTMLRLALGDVE